MKKTIYVFAILLIFGCQSEKATEWTNFQKCQGRGCVESALLVNQALVAAPETILKAMHTAEKSNESLNKWIQIMRDSVITNPSKGTYDQRVAMRNGILNTARTYANNLNVGATAKTIVEEMESIAMQAELEEEESDQLEVPLTGTYAYDNGADKGASDLLIGQISATEFKFSLTVVGGAPAHNQGLLEGVATLTEPNEASFTTKDFGGDCTIVFRFGDGVTLKTKSGDSATCGFGNNVMADGEYKRRSYNDPFLSKKDGIVAANLVGNWQSTQDPKSGITITDGNYHDWYEGTDPGPKMRYIYYPTCPKDCNPVAKTPCLKIIGQDDVCFTVVKADGKVLELSQIGGTGNTNKYKKK